MYPLHPGRYVILALIILAAACKDSPGGPSGPATPAVIAATTPASVEGTVGDTVPLAVRVTSSQGEGVPNVRVGFTVTAGGGSMTSVTVTTDASGQASATWTLGTTVGRNRATATVDQLAPVEFVADARAGAAFAVGLQTQPGGARIGAMLRDQPVVEIRDRFGNRVTNTSAAVTAHLSGGEGALRGTSSVAGVDGIVRFADLELSGPVGPRTLRFTSGDLQEASSTSFVLMPPARSVVDRADDVTGSQVHVIYVLPSDGADRSLDTEVSLAYSVASFQRWLAQQTGGRMLRMDTFHGAVDVTFFRLSKTDQEIVARGPFVRDEIERQLAAAGRIVPGKLYAVYYDGGSTYACGGAAWPPDLPGQVAAMYLRGLANGPVSCASSSFVSLPTDFPRYWEFAMLHDMLHVAGIVSRHAPNHTAEYPAHVPEPHDLMYSGRAPWQLGPATMLDVGGNDYFGAAVPSRVANLLTSPYLTPAPAGSVFAATLSPLSAPQAQQMSTAAAQLPVHPRFELLMQERK
jgi:hypothetical protein